MRTLPLPLRLALVLVLAVAGAWTTLLRPSGEVPTDPPIVLPAEAQAPAPAAGAPTASRAPLAGGRETAAGSGGVAAPVEPASATPAAPAAKPATAAARPAAAAKRAASAPARRAAPATDRATSVLAALDEGRAAVLLFSDGRGADDRQVRAVVSRLSRRGGRVLVRRAPIAEVGRYEPITRSVPVVASPTILVIGPSRSARSIAGVTTAAELEQAVADALDLSGDPVGQVRFARAQAVRRARRSCEGQPCVAHFTTANDRCLAAASRPADAAAGLPAIRADQAAVAALATQLAGVAAPAAQRPGQARAVAALQRRAAVMDRALTSSRRPAVVRRRIARSAAIRRAGTELRRLGYAACAA